MPPVRRLDVPVRVGGLDPPRAEPVVDAVYVRREERPAVPERRRRSGVFGLEAAAGGPPVDPVDPEAEVRAESLSDRRRVTAEVSPAERVERRERVVGDVFHTGR